MDRYELLASAEVSGIIPIKKYRSKETGFTICIANVDGPLVNGYFCLATEAHDDDGLPHTLEHLVFMGSEEYPYKGMLDLFANRCLAQGTNAWTDTDHTCYTMTTAGSEGFLNLLPIYLDHVLYPTLTDSSFTTEVHHINGSGEDAGVVYCEMQARENTGHSRTYLELQRAMYPGICGYKSETGGIMKNLRESCSNEKVRKFHAEFYRPENLCLIITGMINPEDVFRVIEPFEQKIKAKGQLPPYVRPWQSDVPLLEKDEEQKHILFSTEDESTGIVLMGWRGPNVLNFYTITALKLLFEYLTDSPVAPLQQELVEIDDPVCGDIDYHFLENKETAICIQADNVPKENLFEIKEKVLNVIKDIASGETPLDMERMQTLLHRSKLEEMNALEDHPHDTLASFSIGDFLFSSHHEQLQDYVDRIKRYEKLKSEPATFWCSLLMNYIIDQKKVIIIGDPSEEFMKKSGEEEESRTQKQANNLGEDGLKNKTETLERAIGDNSVEPPADLVTKLPIPSTDSISFYKVETISNRSGPNVTENDKFDKFPIGDIPCQFNVFHVNSLFAQVYTVIDTVKLTQESRMYLPLYCETLFESPLLKDGKLIPYEDVVKQLAADTLQYDANIGLGGGRFSPGRFSSLVIIEFKVETEKYIKCIEWIKDILFNLQFSTDRLKIIANKMINDVANHKRNGRKVASSLIKDISFTKENNIYCSNMIRQHTFLTKLVAELDTNPQKVVAEMETLRKCLLLPQRFRFYVSANLDKLPSNPHSIWKQLLFKDMENSLENVQKVSSDGTFCSNKLQCKAVGVGSVESAFLIQSCPGVNGYDHPDYAALLVFIEYLCALEGPLWRQIRGCGYSYNYRIYASPNTGKLSFILAKSTHVFKAYEVAKQIIDGFITGTTPFETSQVDAAKSGVIFQTIENEDSISQAVEQIIDNEYRGVSRDFNRALLKKVSQVTVEDLKRVGETYFQKFFDPSCISLGLCCHPTKLNEIIQSFQGIGVQFEPVKSLEEEFAQ